MIKIKLKRDRKKEDYSEIVIEIGHLKFNVYIGSKLLETKKRKWRKLEHGHNQDTGLTLANPDIILIIMAIFIFREISSIKNYFKSQDNFYSWQTLKAKWIQWNDITQKWKTSASDVIKARVILACWEWLITY